MKNLLFILGLFLLSNILIAQETNSSFSDVENYCFNSGKIVKGNTLFIGESSSYGSHNISLIEYYEDGDKDTIFGISFYGSIAFSDSYVRRCQVILDYEEIDRILIWIETVNKEINKDTQVDYISYSPVRGKLLLYVTRLKSNSEWSYRVQFDKSDIFSMAEFPINRLKDLKLNLEEMQKIISNRTKY